MKTMQWIVGCMVLASSLSHGMNKTLQDLKIDLQTEEANLKKDESFTKNSLTDRSIAIRKKKIESLQKAIIDAEQQTSTASQFKEKARRLREVVGGKVKEEKPVLKQAKELGQKIVEKVTSVKKLNIKDIYAIDKLVAANDNLFLLYKTTQSQIKLEKLDPNDVDRHSSITSEEEATSSLIFCDIAAYDTYYAYGYFLKPSKGQAQSVIIREDGSKTSLPEGQRKISKAHKTPIKSLFFDNDFIVSHSKFGTIRIFYLKDFKNDEKQIDSRAEYTAEKLLDYHNKCMVVEEHSLIFGTELFIKYLDDKAQIIKAKKIGTYKKEVVNDKKIDDSPYLAAINDQGQVVMYDKRNKALIHSFKHSDNSIFSYAYKSSTGLLPKELDNRVAQQIHYVNNTVLLVYDDQIYEITMPNGQKQETPLTTNLLFHLKQPLITPETKEKMVETIVATAVQNNTLWIINKKGEAYFMQSINMQKV